MADYNIPPGEVLIHRVSNVAHGQKLSRFLHELVLTDKNLVLHVKNRRGRARHTRIFAVDKIKQVHGKPQAIVGSVDHVNTLDVYFHGGTEHFRFLKADDAAALENKIYELVTGIPLPNNGVTEGSLIFGSEKVTDVVKQTVGAFRSAFGFPTKSTADQTRAVPVRVAGDCVSCGAPIAGYRRRRIVCEYCNTTNLL